MKRRHPRSTYGSREGQQRLHHPSIDNTFHSLQTLRETPDYGVNIVRQPDNADTGPASTIPTSPQCLSSQVLVCLSDSPTEPGQEAICNGATTTIGPQTHT
jgi:hypothetical protein